MTYTPPAHYDPFIPEIWAQRALDIAREQIVLARLVAKDTDVATFTRGQVLHIPYPGTFTATDKTTGSDVTVQTPGTGEVTVTLDRWKEVTFMVEDAARAMTDMQYMERHVESAALALVRQIEEDLFALYADLAHAAGAAGTDLNAAAIRNARKILNDAKAPMTNRFFVVSTKDEVALLADAELREYFANARPQAVSEANLGRVYGFDVWMSQLVPEISGTPPTFHNIAAHREALLLAMRALPEPPTQTGVKAAAVRDPQSGLVFRSIVSYNPQKLAVQVTLDVLYGVKALRPEFGIDYLS